MTWNIASSALDMATSGFSIEPRDILYKYDSPLLFVARMGLADVLCYKLEETERNELYLITPTDSDVVRALKEGQLSIRGALNASAHWIVESVGFKVVRAWSVLASDIPVDFWPESKLGLFEHFGEVPDIMGQFDSFLSVKFSGPELHQSGLSFRTFKNLVDSVYDLAHKFFTPKIFAGSRVSNFFDFKIAQPKFASLLITINEPIFDVDAFRRRRNLSNSIMDADIRSELSTDRDEFFVKAGELAKIAQTGRGLEGFVSENYTFVDDMVELTPSIGGAYNRVELNARTETGRAQVIIDEQAGARIRAAREQRSTTRRQVHGTVVEVNSLKRTFVIAAKGGRQTTCAFPYGLYDRFEESGDIRIGEKASVLGNFKARPRRDYIWSDHEPTFG